MTAETLAEVTRVAQLGRQSVRATWGPEGPQSVTVLVGTRDDLEAVVGPTTGLPVAAVTYQAEGARPGDSSQILLDQSQWLSLSPTARQVVLTHELVHVATGSVDAATPRWLEEGLADYVGFRGTAVPTRTAAREALDAEARQGLPAALPTDSDFNLGGPEAAVAYGQAYVAARVIAQTYGDDALYELYRRANADLARLSSVGGSPDTTQVQAALAESVRVVTGASLDDLVRAWRAELARLATGTP